MVEGRLASGTGGVWPWLSGPLLSIVKRVLVKKTPAGWVRRIDRVVRIYKPYTIDYVIIST
jgi:hypothetical protein